MTNRYRPPLPTLLASPLLITESSDEFDRINADLHEQISPRGIVEEICVADVAYLTWESLRIRRCKAQIINGHFRDALASLLDSLIRDPEQYGFEVEEAAADIATKWFTDNAIKKQAQQLLKVHHLDESAILAEAFRLSATQLEPMDRMQASAEVRRDRVIRSIPEYRFVFAKLLRDTSDRIIDGKVLEPSPALGDGRAAAR
jgi:hypothetical protein